MDAATLTPAQCRELLSHAGDQRFRDLLEFLLLTDARPTEVIGVRREHLTGDEQGPLLRLQGRQPRIIRLCTRAARLTGAGVDVVQRKNGKFAVYLGNVTYDNRYLFINGDGQPWTMNALKKRLKVIKRKMGLAHLTWRTLRQTHWVKPGLVVLGPPMVSLQEDGTILVRSRHKLNRRGPGFFKAGLSQAEFVQALRELRALPPLQPGDPERRIKVVWTPT